MTDTPSDMKARFSVNLARPPIPRYIGVVGRKHHGKSAVVTVLAELGYRVGNFADPLKRAFMEIYDLTYAQAYGDQKEVVDPRYGITPREIFQRGGTEVGRQIYGDTWIDKLRDDMQRYEARGEVPRYFDGADRLTPKGWRWQRSLQDTRSERAGCRWAVGDTRFYNEVGAIVDKWGGEVWRVVRPGLPPSGVGDDHESELYADSLPAKREISNDGDLEALTDKVLMALMLASGASSRTHMIDPRTGEAARSDIPGEPVTLVYGWDGGLVGDPFTTISISHAYGVLQPERPAPEWQMATVGKSVWGPHTGAWWGWSNRASMCFRVGGVQFDPALLDPARPDYAKWGALPHNLVGTQPITTDDEARASAAAFAQYAAG